MATLNVVTPGNLSNQFSIGGETANEITIVEQNMDIVSGDAGNVLTQSGTDGGAFFNQAALQTIETVWAGTVGAASGALVITAGGTNGHAPTFTMDYTNADFIEGVQDAIGQAVLAGAGITYDDVADSISSTLGNLTFGDGLTSTGTTAVAVLPNPASVLPVTVSAAGVAVAQNVSADAGNLATLGTDNRVNVAPAAVENLMTIDVCDAFNTSLFLAHPT